ncbi:hypothetical protein HDU97_008262 [Phlyctochytrium planicorne]|nr:hypothetical protein HDU97_008262 [Phlyctochytrium planicorne]
MQRPSSASSATVLPVEILQSFFDQKHSITLSRDIFNASLVSRHWFSALRPLLLSRVSVARWPAPRYIENHFPTLNLGKPFNPEQATEAVKLKYGIDLDRAVALARWVERLHVQNMQKWGEMTDALSMLLKEEGGLGRLLEFGLMDSLVDEPVYLQLSKGVQPGGFLSGITFLRLERLEMEPRIASKFASLRFPHLTGFVLIKNSNGSTRIRSESVRKFVYAHPKLKVLICPNLCEDVDAMAKLKEFKLEAFYDTSQVFSEAKAVQVLELAGLSATIERFGMRIHGPFCLPNFVERLPKLKELSIASTGYVVEPSHHRMQIVPPLRALEFSSSVVGLERFLEFVKGTLEVLVVGARNFVGASALAGCGGLRVFKGALYAREDVPMLVKACPLVEIFVVTWLRQGSETFWGDVEGWKLLKRVGKRGHGEVVDYVEEVVKASAQCLLYSTVD